MSSTAEATVDFSTTEPARTTPPRAAPASAVAVALDANTQLLWESPTQGAGADSWQARHDRLAQARARSQAETVGGPLAEELQPHVALLRWAAVSTLLFVAAGWAGWQWLQADSHLAMNRQSLDPQQLDRLLPASADAPAPLAAAAATAPVLRLQLDWLAQGGRPQGIAD